MNIIDLINNNMAYFTIGLLGATFVLLILVLIIMVKYRKLNKKYIKFMSGANGENLEKEILGRFTDIDRLKDSSNKIKTEINEIKDNLLLTYQKIGVNKYDAFKEMGGKLSFALALLDNNNNGFLLNSMHSSREGCYTYIKEIIKGESFVELSGDEKKALSQALSSNNFMK